MKNKRNRKTWVISSGFRKQEPFKNLIFQFYAVILKSKSTEKKMKWKPLSPELSLSFCFITLSHFCSVSSSLPFREVLITSGKFVMIINQSRIQEMQSPHPLYLDRKFKDGSDFLSGDPPVSPCLSFHFSCGVPHYGFYSWLGLQGMMALTSLTEDFSPFLFLFLT